MLQPVPIRIAVWRSTARILAACSLTIAPVHAWACSRILSNDNGQANIVGRTMDLYRFDDAKMAVFPRGMERVSLAGGDSPLKWNSRYGSVAVTTLGVATTDGMNEQGLVANLLYLGDTKYEARDDRPGLSNLQWAQYVLDNFATVEEAVKAMNEL